MNEGDVLFEKEFFVRLLLDERTSTPEFNIGGPHSIRINFSPLTPEQQQEHHDAVLCRASGTWSLRAEILDGLRKVSRGLLPDGREQDQAWREYAEKLFVSPASSTRSASTVDLFPKPFRDCMQSISAELHREALNLVGLIRWRMDARGDRNPVRRSRGLRASFDGTEWWLVPIDAFEIDSWHEIHAQIEPHIEVELARYVVGGLSEPLGHELLREAFSTRAKNPRTALIMAMTALEVGLKEYIADLVPDAEWLAFEAPSPPVVKILSAYLPKLRSRSNDGVFRSPPKDLVDTITKGVTLRNAAAHKGEAKIRRESLREIIRAVSNVLRVLDYHRGHAWARSYVDEHLARSWIDGASD